MTAETQLTPSGFVVLVDGLPARTRSSVLVFNARFRADQYARLVRDGRDDEALEHARQYGRADTVHGLEESDPDWSMPEPGWDEAGRYHR